MHKTMDQSTETDVVYTFIDFNDVNSITILRGSHHPHLI